MIPHISIRPEPIFAFHRFIVTNSVLATAVVSVLFILLALYYKIQSTKPKANRSLFFYTVNKLLTEVYTLFHSVTEDKITILFPLLGAFFLFILMENWFGLLPGVGSILVGETPLLRGGAADLNMTLALGVIAVIMVQYYGFKYLGFGGYLSKFFNFSNPINFFIGILEIVSEVSRTFSFSFRLFGNIIAGEILLVIIASLIPVFASFPFLVMEIFVGLIQAVVFSTLAAIFIKMAVTSHSQH